MRHICYSCVNRTSAPENCSASVCLLTLGVHVCKCLCVFVWVNAVCACVCVFVTMSSCNSSTSRSSRRWAVENSGWWPCPAPLPSRSVPRSRCDLPPWPARPLARPGSDLCTAWTERERYYYFFWILRSHLQRWKKYSYPLIKSKSIKTTMTKNIFLVELLTMWQGVTSSIFAINPQ